MIAPLLAVVPLIAAPIAYIINHAIPKPYMVRSDMISDVRKAQLVFG
jgi:hypothetical protein